MVLFFIADRPGLNQISLVHATGVDRTTVADMILRLQRKGPVRRRRSNRDARAYTLTLTQAGKDLVTSTVPGSRKLDDRIFWSSLVRVDVSCLGRLHQLFKSWALAIDERSRPVSSH
jgi:DNA-binding MarR family transcriptional regulator